MPFDRLRVAIGDLNCQFTSDRETGCFDAPPQGVARVPDARGRVRGDNVGGRHFANGEPASIDAEFLLAVARAVIAMVNSREYARGRV